MADIVARVRKLLKITRESGASQQEVETAARLAQELMLEHKLAEADVSVASDDGSQIIDLPAGKEGFMASWRFALVTAVARAFFCEAIGLRVGRTRKVRIVGRRQDAEVVIEVTSFLVAEIERLTAEYAKIPEEEFFLDELFEGATPAERRKAYRAGLAQGVSMTLRDQAANWRAASEKALAIYRKSREEVGAYMSNKFGDSRKAKVASKSTHLSAFDDGVARGLQIRIQPGAKTASVSPGEIGGKGDGHDGNGQHQERD